MGVNTTNIGFNRADPLATILMSLNKDATTELNKELAKLIPEYARRADAINAEKKGKTPYHKGPHSREMAADAARIRKVAINFFKNKDGVVNEEALDLYITLFQVMHAAHDIVQGVPGHQQNEILSAIDFNERFKSVVKKIPENNLSRKQRVELFGIVTRFAMNLIVEGTVFDPKTFQQPAIVNALKGIFPTSPLLAISKIHIAMNDTNRMLTIPEMLYDPEYAYPLNRQYEALKNTMLVKTLVEGNMMHGSDLYNFVHRNLKPVAQPKPSVVTSPDLVHKAPRELMSLFTFMQIFGQNLRVNSEFSPESDKAAALFRTYLDTGSMPQLDINKDKELIDAAFRFIIIKMEREVSATGFCQGMTWTTTGIDTINANFRAQTNLDFDVLSSVYKDAWPDYIRNANHVLKTVQDKAKSLKGDAQYDFKLEFIRDCLNMSRNQVGLFLMQQDKGRPEPIQSRL